MRRVLAAIVVFLSVLPAVRAAEPTDSLARALATFWGTSFKTDDLSARERSEFLRGLRDVLHNDSTGRDAYMRGAAMAVNVLDGFDQMTGLGMKADRDELVKAIIAVAEGKNVGFTQESAGEYIDEQFRRHSAELFSPESQDRFLRESAAAEGAVTTPSGLVFRVVTEGEGSVPPQASKARVSYKGMLSDGTVFDSTDEPIELDLNRVVPGFAEGIRMMKPGGTYDIVIPATLAYGDRGAGGGTIPPGAAIRFIVNLISTE